MIENLESRVLLSSSLVNGVLTINGTSGADAIEISQFDFRSRLVVVEGQRATGFDSSEIRRIVVLGNAGNDVIRAGECKIPLFVDAGKGHDVIIGGKGDDTLVGGAGNDRLGGWLGQDLLDGGAGRDILIGGAGNDTFYAAADEGRRDVIDGGLGNDFSDARDRSRNVERFGSGEVPNAVVPVVVFESGSQRSISHESFGQVSVLQHVGPIIRTPPATSVDYSYQYREPFQGGVRVGIHNMDRFGGETDPYWLINRPRLDWCPSHEVTVKAVDGQVSASVRLTALYSMHDITLGQVVQSGNDFKVVAQCPQRTKPSVERAAVNQTFDLGSLPAGDYRFILHITDFEITGTATVQLIYPFHVDAAGNVTMDKYGVGSTFWNRTPISEQTPVSEETPAPATM